jgi:hypothetical protein
VTDQERLALITDLQAAARRLAELEKAFIDLSITRLELDFAEAGE